MAPIFSLAFALAALPAAVLATNAQSWSGTSCNSGDHLFWSGHSIACQQLGNVRSISVDNIDSGCTITYYSDSSCSNDASPARVGQCSGYNTGGPIKSWSWDC
ncbi:hypothetical protein EJ04DRAFT_559711 [Polyplosphaeria fusca]|uniref:Uncharacterized protein n=1 Tax=Polyplosphaeria fusca TaxID=682080 RepID=A0A9P4V8S6_9PLEO|nr:hypothetical protein EJ04DRAFT_559711 [Polyplosphaeria fusca]